jgi:hypothetical protein
MPDMVGVKGDFMPKSVTTGALAAESTLVKTMR